MTIRFGSLLLPLALLGQLAHAQNAPALAPPANTTPGVLATNRNGASPLAPTFAQIRAYYAKGMFYNIIETATNALDQTQNGKPNPRLLYWRGLAQRRVSLFDGAKSDLEQLGDYSIAPNFPPASKIVAQVNELIALRPSHEYDVKSDDGKKVLFRVYSSEDDEFLHTVLNALPKAYTTAAAFTGTDTENVPIFVFDLAHYPDFVKFFSTFIGHPVLNWSQSVTSAGAITISQRNERNVAGRPANDPRMTRTLSHEMTHELMMKLIGRGKRTSTPDWFTEGIAQVCENTLDPTVYTQNDRMMKALVAQNAILPLDKIDGNKDFHDAVTQRKNGEQKGSPYPQGLNMTRFLVTRLKDGNIASFLRAIRDNDSFEAALQQETGLNEQQFYEAWVKTLDLPKMPATP